MPIKLQNLEGATPLDDISGLKITWIQTQDQLNAVEADNIRLAKTKYLSNKRFAFPKWFSVSHINLIHKAMFGKVWKWAGKYRSAEKNVGVSPFTIPIELRQLEEDMLFWGQEKSFEPIETAARIHHRLVYIHPYENGNGRHGRLVGDMVLRALGHNPILWPRISDSGKKRDLYIQGLKDADDSDFTALIAFLTCHSP